MVKAILKFIAFVIACILIAIASGIVSFMHFSDNDTVSFRDLAKLEKIEETIKDVSQEKELAAEKNIRTNILISSIEKSKSDVIILASIEHNNKEIDIIFIPRDTFYKFQGGIARNVDKLKNIYEVLGVEGLKEAVEDILHGIQINHYVTVDYKGFINIIDSIGGVTVQVEERMFYEDPFASPPLLINFSSGTHTLNGRDSLKYIRYIGGSIVNTATRENDLGRIEAIKNFTREAIKKSFTHRLPVIIRTAFKHVDTDIGDANIASLLAIVATLEQKDIRIHTVPGYMVEGGFFVHDRDKTRVLLEGVFTD